MNLERGWLLMGKPRRLAPVCLCAALAALGVRHSFAVWDEPYAAPGQALEANVLPGNDQQAATDLQLHGEPASKADAFANFSEAIMAEDNGDSDAALADYQKALALDPGYTELAVKVAFELAQRGDPSSAVEVLKDSIKAAPQVGLPYIYLSEIYANNLSKPEIGLKYAEQALDLDPRNFTSYLAVMDIDDKLHQPQKAEEVLNRATKSTSTDPHFWLQLGDTLLKPYADTSALPPGNVEKISAVYQKALALDGTDPATLEHVGDFYVRVHQEKAAIPVYLKAIKYSPANPPEDDDTLANIRDNLANCFNAVGQTGDAIAILKDLIKENPMRYESYELLYDLYEKTNQTDAGLAICQQMMLLNQGDYRNYVRTAALLMKQQKMDAAIQTLADARTKFPNESEITYSLGLALSEAKRYPEALGIFEQAEQEASEGQTDMLDAQFYFAYGAAAEQCGQVERAATLLKKSIDLDPQSAAEAYNYLGYMWVDRGMNLDQAVGYIRKALDMDPNNPAYVDSLGWYYFKKGDLKQALATLKKAATTIQPEDATVDEHVGDAYAAMNDTTHALDYWQRSASLDKDNKEITVKIAGARQKLAREGGPTHPTQ